MERLDVYPLVDPHVRNSWKMVISYELPFFDDNCSIECSPSNDVLGVIRKKKKKKCRKIEDPPLFFSYLHLRESLHSFYICLFSFDPVSLSLYLFFRLAPTLCGGP